MDLSWLWGDDEPSNVTLAPNRPYPSNDDLAFARQFGAFYDTGSDLPYHSYEIRKGNLPATSLDGLRIAGLIGSLDKVQSPDLIDTLAKAKLASRRSAITSLGMNNAQDMNVISNDIGSGAYGTTVGGVVGEPMLSLSTIYDDDNNQSTPAHEATHRGLWRILDRINKGSITDQLKYHDLAQVIAGSGQEPMVRALMFDKFGNPEEGRMPVEYEKLLHWPEGRGRLDKAREMNSLAETLAARMIYENKPGGPW